MTRALLAGIIATIVVSLVLVAQQYFGFLPEFHLIKEWEELIAAAGIPIEISETGFGAVEAWVAHTVVGVVIYGIVYAALEPILPGNGLTEGLTFGIITFLLMMLVFMPLAGFGLFGATLGWESIVGTLVLHLIYGGVLGVTYQILSAEDEW